MSAIASRRALGVAGAYYFLFYGAIGCYFPYLSLYFKEIGLSGQAIGTLAALTPLTMIVAAPLWGALGDKFHIRRQLLPLATWGTILPTLALGFTRDFNQLALLTVLASCFASPLIPLIDSATLDLLEGTGKNYGAIRLWGSLGFIAFTLVMSALLPSIGLGRMFYLYAGIQVVAGLIALWLPAPSISAHAGFSAGLRQLITHRPLLLFFASIFLIGVAFSASLSFLPIHLSGLGASLALISWANITASVCELPSMFFSRQLFRYAGVRGSLLLGYATYALRWGLVALTRQPWQVVGLQTLHGVSYGPTTMGSVAFVKQSAPPGVEATAQSLMNTANFGVGAAVGAYLGGWLYQQWGTPSVFVAASASAGLGVLLLVAALAPRLVEVSERLTKIKQALAGGKIN